MSSLLLKNPLQHMVRKWGKNHFQYVTCDVCKIGKFGAIVIQQPCCDNPKCQLYDSFYMAKCGICRAVRRECCC